MNSSKYNLYLNTHSNCSGTDKELSLTGLNRSFWFMNAEPLESAHEQEDTNWTECII